MSKAHPFFWALLGGVLVAAGAAWELNPAPAKFALNSLWLQRVEVGLAVFVGIYLLLILLWLAYHGRSVRRVELPGGGAVEAPEALDQAASDLEEFKGAAEARFTELETAVEDLDARAPAPKQ